MKKALLLIGLVLIVAVFSHTNVGAVVVTKATAITNSNVDAGNIKGLAKDNLGNYYIVFKATTASNWSIYVRKSDDGGVTWKYWNGTTFAATGTETPIESTPGYNGQNAPTLAIDSSNNLHVAWDGQDGAYTDYIRYMKYTVGSGTWSSPVNIQAGTYPVMTIDSSNNIYILWDGVKFAKSTNGGTTWSTPASIGTGSNVGVDVDTSNNIHAVWANGTVIQYSQYNGTSWSTPVNVFSSANSVLNPGIAVGSDNIIHVVWQENIPFTYSIQYSKSTNNGAAWAAPTLLSQSGMWSANPTIAVDSSNAVYVLWWGYTIAQSSQKQIVLRKYTSSWSAVTNITTGSGTWESFPSIAKGAFGFIWKGSVDGSMNATSNYGVTFYGYVFPTQSSSTPVAADIANNGDARDIRVTFNGASNETGINNYRIFVVPSAQAAAFNEPTASALASARYVVEAANGNGGAHTVTLPQALLDSGGGTIQNNSTYKVFVLSVGQAGYTNSLSSSSSPVTLVVPSPASGTPLASNVSNYGDARDIKVAFRGAGNETNIANYRIFVVPSSQVGSFDLTAASTAVSAGNYQTEAATGARVAHILNLNQSLLDTAGNPISSPNSYKVFIMSVGQNGFGNTLTASSTVTLSSSVNTLAQPEVPRVADIANNGDGRDLKVSFRGLYNESNVTEYRIIVVPAASAGSFDKTAANSVVAARYLVENKTGARRSHVVTLNNTLLDSAGGAIASGTAYRVFILAVAGTGSTDNSLSLQSSSITLLATVPAPSAVTNLEAADITDNNDASDIQVKFRAVINETNVQEYRIFVVPSASAGSFNLTAANGNSNYYVEAKTTARAQHAATLDSSLLDTAGQAISNGNTYKIFVLSVGQNGYANRLSSGTGDLTLQ